MASARDARWEESEKSFRRAIELDPNYPAARGQFAFFVLFPLGRINEALQQLRIAEKNDPFSPILHYQLAYVLMSAGRYQEAAGHCPKADFKTVCLGHALLGQGKI